MQETSRHVFNKLQVQNVFVFSSLYDPFYCNMICFTAVFKIRTAVAMRSHRLPICIVSDLPFSQKQIVTDSYNEDRRPSN